LQEAQLLFLRSRQIFLFLPTVTYAGSPFVFTAFTNIGVIVPTTTGTITSCTSSTALPTGIILNNTTCALSGTPTLAQVATNYVITVTNATGSNVTTIQITINPPPPSAYSLVLQ
jgi:hypothetical protein